MSDYTASECFCLNCVIRLAGFL